MSKLYGSIEGRDVHYVLDNKDVPDRYAHQVAGTRAAKIVNSWGGNSCVNLMVFSDFVNDGHPEGIFWVTSAYYSSSGEPGTWHWIPHLESNTCGTPETNTFSGDKV